MMLVRMRYRTLGSTGLKISEVGYGAWGIGGKQWQGGTDDESVASLRRAFELGLNFVDTALAYGDGHSERLVGSVVSDAPQPIYLATKVPPKNRVWPAPAGIAIDEVFPEKYIIECTEQSLRNLKVERVDLQQLHVWDAGWTERDEWKRAFEKLRQAGKVAWFGISINDHQPDSALALVRTGLIQSVQVIYNIFDQSPAVRLLPEAAKSNVGVIARVPFDAGSLTGNIRVDSQFQGDEFRAMYFRGDRKKEVVERVNRLQEDLGTTNGSLAEVALRFCLSHPAVTTVIPGMRKVRNVEANCAVPDKGPLDERTLGILQRHVWHKNFYQ